MEAPSQLEQVFVGVWQTCKQCLAMLPKLSVPDAHWNFCKLGLGRSNLGKIEYIRARSVRFGKNMSKS